MTLLKTKKETKRFFEKNPSFLAYVEVKCSSCKIPDFKLDKTVIQMLDPIFKKKVNNCM